MSAQHPVVHVSGAPSGSSTGPGTRPGTGASRWEDPRLAAARDVSDLIAQAKRQLMRDHGLGPQEAFELLRHYSRTSDLPLRDVARKLVHGTWLPRSPG